MRGPGQGVGPRQSADKSTVAGRNPNYQDCRVSKETANHQGGHGGFDQRGVCV